MRKDVRLALAVCSVLLFAVLVYVLFFTGPGTRKTGPANLGGTGGSPVAVNPGGGATGGSVNSGTSTGVNPLTSVRPGDPGVAPAPGIWGGIPTTRPVDPPVNPVVVIPPAPEMSPLARGDTFDWGGALHHGLSANGGARTEGASGSAAGALAGQAARKYQVKPTETLWGIARAEYGNAAYVNHIIRANPGIDANRLRAGTIINLPEKTEVIPETGPARLAVASAPIDPATQYRVQAGDNLFNIAKKLYGNINRAGKLYEANKDIIGPNPNALKLNAVLRLPDPPTSAATPVPAGDSRPEPAFSDLR